MGGKIAGIVPGSIAEEIGIEPGDTLVAINDNPVNDLIDYNYYEDGEYLITLSGTEKESELIKMLKSLK